MLVDCVSKTQTGADTLSFVIVIDQNIFPTQRIKIGLSVLYIITISKPIEHLEKKENNAIEVSFVYCVFCIFLFGL